MIVGFEVCCPDCDLGMVTYEHLVAASKLVVCCPNPTCNQLYLLEAKSKGKTLYYFSLKRLGYEPDKAPAEHPNGRMPHLQR